MKKERAGELLMLSSTILEAFFPIITILSFAALPPMVSLAWTTVFAMLFFGVTLIVRGHVRELANPRVWLYGAYVALTLGIAFYALLFIALQHTSAGNFGILLLFQVFTSYVFFNLIKKEPYSKERVIGSVLVVLGAIILLGKDFSDVNFGDALVLLACCIAPIGNYFQQEARNFSSSESLLFVRTLISVPVLFALCSYFVPQTSFVDVRSALPYLALNGVLLFGCSKILWIEAIHRISVTKAVALYSITPLFVLLLAWAILGQQPSMWQFASLLPFFLGVLLLTDNWKFRPRNAS